MIKKVYFILTVVIITIVYLSSCRSKDKVLHMATKPMTEQYILGSIVKALIEEQTDIKVKLTEGVGGGTLNIHPAILSGDFDIYPEYTGTGWNAVLKENSTFKENMFNKLQSKYSELDLAWVGMLGFNNTYGIGVREEIAEKYNLKTFSDLSRVDESTIFGGEYDFFEREDGYKLLQNTYGLDFSKTVDLDIGLKYNAIAQGEIDVVNIFTTDGRLKEANIVVLKDDKEMYPSYKCGFVVRKEVLEKYPELQEIFTTLENSISDEDMTLMNYSVEILGEDYKSVARSFLKQKRLIKE